MKEFEIKWYFVVFLNTAEYKKGNHGVGQNRVRIGVYRVVQTHYWALQFSYAIQPHY